MPSIIDGACDRLRPVLLTTLTTVLGMTPLLYETSRQAQFLKPTVITLVYGLGFGMVLVLLVVPALLAVQHDIARRMTAMRRGFGLRPAARSFVSLTRIGRCGPGDRRAGALCTRLWRDCVAGIYYGCVVAASCAAGGSMTEQVSGVRVSRACNREYRRHVCCPTR